MSNEFCGHRGQNNVACQQRGAIGYGITNANNTAEEQAASEVWLCHDHYTQEMQQEQVLHPELMQDPSALNFSMWRRVTS